MRYLLNVVYLLLVAAASPWLLSAAVRHGKYRDGYGEKFWGRVPRRDGDAPCVWLHAVSVGEVNLLGVLIKELRARRPGWTIVVSSTTRTGLELARKKYADVTTFYCPLDFSWAVDEALRRVRPNLLVLAELELWPNLIAAAERRGVPVAVVNGRLSEKSFRGYAKLRFFMRRLLKKLALVLVQNDEYRERFAALGCEATRLITTGSLKFDGAQQDRGNPTTRRLAQLAGISSSDVVFLAGSTQEGEEAAALDAYRALVGEFPQLRLILVPRHVERFDDVARLLERSGLPFVRRSLLGPLPPVAGGERSEAGEGRAANESASNVARRDPHPAFGHLLPQGEGIADREGRILLVDAVGELGAWWGSAQVAFVGGSFGDRGGQNMLEPAAYGAAVSFGPNTWNFREIADRLLAAGGAVRLADPAELTLFVRRCLTDQAFAAELGERARRLVAANLGATARTVELLVPLVERTNAARAAPPKSLGRAA
ncbi:MAG: 3-deoxy-D-manno-octulosonic acid transferase [Planctomycetaceae bacterium]|nr:3-deoxy-D-manno-octulosonic acid transferase [Planctomycetaceae bacterium]